MSSVHFRIGEGGEKGAWRLPGAFRVEAKRAFEMSQEAAKRMNDTYDALVAQLGEDGANRRFPFLIETEVNLLAHASTTLSAMTMEALLNQYGVVRLGERFYTDHCERLGVVPKLALLLATCAGKQLEGDAEIITVARRLAESRNALVHPKTRELAPKEPITFPKQGPVENAHDAVRDMERFLELFEELDPTARKMIEAL